MDCHYGIGPCPDGWSLAQTDVERLEEMLAQTEVDDTFGTLGEDCWDDDTNCPWLWDDGLAQTDV